MEERDWIDKFCWGDSLWPFEVACCGVHTEFPVPLFTSIFWKSQCRINFHVQKMTINVQLGGTSIPKSMFSEKCWHIAKRDCGIKSSRPEFLKSSVVFIIIRCKCAMTLISTQLIAQSKILSEDDTKRIQKQRYSAKSHVWMRFVGFPSNLLCWWQKTVFRSADYSYSWAYLGSGLHRHWSC